MRYYEITISPSQFTTEGTAFEPFTISSQYNGKDNYSSLDIYLDIIQNWYHEPTQMGSLKVYGIDFSNLYKNLNYAQIQIKVGMTPGLPLINTTVPPLQIINGMILQSYGNWQGTNVSLDFIIVPWIYDYTGTNKPLSFEFNWQAGKTLQNAIIECIGNAFLPVGYQPVFTGGLSNNLVYPENLLFVTNSFFAFAKQVNVLSRQVYNNPLYLGASITETTDGFVISDGTLPQTDNNTTNIEYTDIIGNLTWINYATLQFKVVMRGDLVVGDYVTLPKGVPITNTAGTYSQFRNNIPYSGSFLINKIHHVGAFRKADGDSWVTIVDILVPAELGTGFEPAIPIA